ncbi:MAG: lysine-2,3-aminomutase-like protein [Alphaproteobacteria bacterium]|nr:lysine-2,3-aminomutase-like protein [Alphaproteobacteria bacterium]
MGGRQRRTARTSADLLEAGVIRPEQRAAIDRLAADFATAVTPAMLDLIDPADPADPIARQFVPGAEEATIAPEERADPIGDEVHSPLKGIVHRYPDRVLLKATHVCPVYCRFCFRREAVGPGGEALSETELADAIDYIRERRDIWEVILSGGDPLMLSPRRLGAIIGQLAGVEHVGVIRVHTRVPVADPARVTAAMVKALVAATPVYVAIHCNHPLELTEAALAALRRLAQAGLPLVAQTVLLKGVNDDADTLARLFRGLVQAHVRPYYLHHGDLARGTSHFRTSIAEGQALMRALRGRVSGLCLPTYVLDIPGGHGKVPVGPAYLHDVDGRHTIDDPWGGHHAYPPVVASPDSTC